jgi:hypothetical protein
VAAVAVWQVVVLHERALVDTLAAILALETQLVVDAAAGAHDLLGVVDETAAAFAAWCSAEHC